MTRASCTSPAACPEAETGVGLLGPSWLDVVQGVLDVVSIAATATVVLEPIGMAADVVNATTSAIEGDWFGVSTSLWAAVPWVGVRGNLARIARNLDSGAATADEILSAAQKWLGPGAREVAPDVFRSADGARQFRMTKRRPRGGARSLRINRSRRPNHYGEWTCQNPALSFRLARP